MKLIDHADIVEKMNAKYGKLYSASRIKAGTLPRLQDRLRRPPRCGI
jgi:hypothetical protein